MSAQHSRRGNPAADGRGQRNNDSKGAEAYPYDPALRLESQHGLDRLRCLADRALAADFFAIFQAAERNTEAAILAEREQAHRDDAELERLCSLAKRTLAGEFGSDEKKLATHLLLDEQGRCATELRALREFRRALIQLKRER
jgi:hypothetical protein